MADDPKLIIEEEAPDEIFTDDGELVASKVETCIYLRCKYHRIKIKANDAICDLLSISHKIKNDPRKGNKDIFICIAHIATPINAMQGPMLCNIFVLL
jgi:hypothetical protein